MEFHTAMEKNKVLLPAVTGMNLTNTILNKSS